MSIEPQLTTESTRPPRPLGMFVGTWLPFSETFIYDQIQGQQRFEAYVCAQQWGEHKDRFPYERVVALQGVERLAYLAGGVSPSFFRHLQDAKIEIIHAHFGPNGAYATHFSRKLDVRWR